MAGTLLGPDQVKKINATFPALVAHIRELLSKDHTGVGLMRVHAMVESFDSDVMSKIFRDLSFISGKEKLALVRAAVYQVMASEPALFVAPESLSVVAYALSETQSMTPKVPEVKEFTPHQFKLNLNKTESFHGERPADTPPPAPVVTSTHTSIVANRLEAGKKAEAAQTEELAEKVAEVRAEEDSKIAAAVAALQAATSPKIIEDAAPVEE